MMPISYRNQVRVTVAEGSVNVQKLFLNDDAEKPVDILIIEPHGDTMVADQGPTHIYFWLKHSDLIFGSKIICQASDQRTCHTGGLCSVTTTLNASALVEVFRDIFQSKEVIIRDLRYVQYSTYEDEDQTATSFSL